MTVTGRFSALILAFALLAALSLLALLSSRAFHHDLEQQMADSARLVEGRADLLWLLYREDRRGLDGLLAQWPGSGTVVAALAYGRSGDTLASAGDSSGAPPFSRVREDHLSTQTSLLGLAPGGGTVRFGPLAGLFHPGARAWFSVPVVGTRNPETRALGIGDFVTALGNSDAGAGGSDFVYGYIHFAFDPAALRRAALGRVAGWLAPWLVLLAAGMAGLALWHRRSLRALDTLAATMDRVATGDFEERAPTRGGRELRDMAGAVNRLAQSLQRHRREIEVGRDLLSRKVEERTHQLSRSHEELERATEAASESAQKLEKLTYYDALTALPNRRLFTEQFGLLMRLARRAGQSVALLFIDLDNLRRVNDSLGHHAGDLLLREVARRLKHCVRDSDVITRLGESEHNIAVSRLGGDEFTVVLNQLDSPEAAAMVARRIIRRLAEPLRIDENDVVAHPRIGIAVYPGDGDNPGTLLNAAATAAQSARKSGDEGFAFYQRGMANQSGHRLRLETELRGAIDRNELTLHYQPQVDTIMGTVVSVEALLRWEHPEHGTIPPADFVNIAEETGMIRRIGDWVLGEACQRLKALERPASQPPRIAVNVAAGQFGPGFADRVRAALDRSGLAPDRLELSLAETVVAVIDEGGIAQLRDLHKQGVYLSLDGYGLGHASLALLGRMPLDELKIEREFLADYREHGRAGPLQALIATARSLDLKAAAEGVESDREYRFLAEQGVRLMQGYLFSEPVPLEALPPMLAPWHFIEQIRRFGSPEPT